MAGNESVVKAEELRCPQCGGTWTLRGFNTTKTLACEYCGSVIDTSAEKWRVVQEVEGAYKSRPRFALGTRGVLEGVSWEVIGWQERSVTSYGRRYPWEEHLLYNPYEGFRYLIYQDGHFAVAEPLNGVPAATMRRATYKAVTGKHFTTGEAIVDEVLGEFPWEVRRGDRAIATDYVAPPRMLSCEESQGEVNWSEVRYLEREVVLDAFGAPTRKLGRPKGVHPCQPNPHKENMKWMGKVAVFALLAWGFLTLGYLGSRDKQRVFETAFVPVAADLPQAGSKGYMLEPKRGNSEFRLEEGGILEFTGRCSVNNQWASYGIMLVGPLDEAEQARFVGMNIYYYHGVSGGESWSEGSQSESVLVRGIPAGRYLVQVQAYPSNNALEQRQMWKGGLNLKITRDVTLWRFVCCSLLLLLAVPLFTLMRHSSFETQRWSQSDHAGS